MTNKMEYVGIQPHPKEDYIMPIGNDYTANTIVLTLKELFAAAAEEPRIITELADHVIGGNRIGFLNRKGKKCIMPHLISGDLVLKLFEKAPYANPERNDELVLYVPLRNDKAVPYVSLFERNHEAA